MAQRTKDRWVLVPGTLCTPQVFDPLLDQLGVSRENCAYLEANAPRVEDYADRLSAAVSGGEIICGFSLGALVVAHNLRALSAARAIVLLASNPWPDPAENYANRIAVRDRVQAGQAADWVRENWAAMSADPNPALCDYAVSMAQATDHLIAAQTSLAASRPGALDLLRETDLPVVFVTGSADKLTPPDLLQGFIGDMKNAALVVPEGLGHFALLEAPERMAESIATGLGRVLSETSKKEPTYDTRNDPFHAA